MPIAGKSIPVLLAGTPEMSGQPTIKAAAMLYTSGSASRDALSDFVNSVKNDSFSVGGLLQELIYDENGVNIGVDAIALDNDDRFPIVRPSKEDIIAGSCGLNRSILTDSSTALRRAIDTPVDLLVVEKFGEREQLGEGLADDILQAMSMGIPTLVAVPKPAETKWAEFTGGLTSIVSADASDLLNWWHNIQ